LRLERFRSQPGNLRDFDERVHVAGKGHFLVLATQGEAEGKKSDLNKPGDDPTKEARQPGGADRVTVGGISGHASSLGAVNK